MLNRGYAYSTVISGNYHGQTLLAHLADKRPPFLETLRARWNIGFTLIAAMDSRACGKATGRAARLAWRAKVAPGLELDFLPPDSPALNLIERVWKLTRRSYLHNGDFEQLSELIHDVECRFDA